MSEPTGEGQHLNYTGLWSRRDGYVSPDGKFEIPRERMWDFLTKFQYMHKLSNITGPSGRSVTAYGEKLHRVLELGADWGHAFSALESCFDEVYGLEKEKACVDRGIQVGRNIIQGTIDSLPFDDDCFDAVVSAHVLEHGISAESTLTEMYRVTKPGGWSVHTLPCTHDGAVETPSWFHSCTLSYTGWKEAFIKFGFEIVTDYFGWATNQEEWIIVARKPNE